MKLEGKAAFGVFRKPSEVNNAKRELYMRGFSPNDIAIQYPTRRGRQDFMQQQSTMIKKGSAIGAIIGALIFGFIGAFLVNMNAVPTGSIQNSLSFSGEAWVIVGGILSGVVLGGACGALIGIGTPLPAGQRYSEYVADGGILMSVHVKDDDEVKEAEGALELAGAQDITLLTEDIGWETVHAKVINL